MIHHIVMIKLKTTTDANEKNTFKQKIKNALEGLPSIIEEIRYYEVGLNVVESGRAFDIVLISHFNSLEDLNKYIVHPGHKNVVKTINQYSEHIISVDYEK